MLQNNRTAMIIAAGDGSRLAQEGSDTLKPLVKINGLPMIERLILILEKYNFSKMRIITNAHSLEVKEYIERAKFNIEIDCLIKTTSSSLHSLYELAKQNEREPFYLFTVDTIFREDVFSAYINYCESNNHFDAVMGITNFIDDEKPLYTKLDGERVVDFLDVCQDCDYVTGGLYYFSRDINIPLEVAVESGVHRLRNFLRLLIKNDYNIGSFAFSKIIDVDHISDIAKAEEFLKK